jgi:hypothetical protein
VKRYSHISKSDYDKVIKIGTQNVACYSKKKLNELFPEGNYSVVAEAGTSASKPDDELTPKQKERLDQIRVGKIDIAGEHFNVFAAGTSNKILNKHQGYICVGDELFIAIHESRVPFIAVISSMAAAILVCLILMVTQVSEGGGGVVVKPDHPLPPVDPNIEKVEDTTEHGGADIEPPETDPRDPQGSEGDDTTQGGSDIDPSDPEDTESPDDTTGEKETDKPHIPSHPDTDPPETDPPETNPRENGSGSVSLVYSLNADVDPLGGNAKIYFKNPAKSSHDLVIELYVLDGEEIKLLAKSGRIPAGYGITHIDLMYDIAPGLYSGTYRISLYDPITGEKASVTPEITGVAIRRLG